MPTEVMLAWALPVTVAAVVAAPLNVAVIVLAAKLPAESRNTTVLALLAVLESNVTVMLPVPALVLIPVPLVARLPTPV